MWIDYRIRNQECKCKTGVYKSVSIFWPEKNWTKWEIDTFLHTSNDSLWVRFVVAFINILSVLQYAGVGPGYSDEHGRVQDE